MIGITPQNPQVGEADVLIIELSPPDEHGFCSFGSSVWGKKRAVQCAKTVIAEVNKGFIRTGGDNSIHVSEIDYFVEHISGKKSGSEMGQSGRKRAEPGKVEKQIAEFTGSLIEDGDVLQIGVGSASEAVGAERNSG